MRLQPSSSNAGPVDMYEVGSYLTDGGVLLSIVGDLPQDPTLRLVEDCRTLEVMVMTVHDLDVAGVRPVEAALRPAA
jgi:hypothetical protein